MLFYPEKIPYLSLPEGIELDKKIVILQTALEKHPEDAPFLYFELGYASCEGGSKYYKQSIDYFYKVLENTEDPLYHFVTHHFLGNIYSQLNDEAMLKIHYDKVLEADPCEPETLFNYAIYYKKRGNLTKALNYIQRIDLTTSERFVLLTHVEILLDMGEEDLAIELLKSFVQEQSDEKAYIELSRIYFTIKNDWDAAILYQKKALEMNPDNPHYAFLLGVAHQMKEDFYRALHYYFQAIKIKPDFSDAYSNIVAIQLHMEGDIKMAIDLLQKALSEVVKPVDRFKLLARLRNLYRSILNYDYENRLNFELLDLYANGYFDQLTEDELNECIQITGVPKERFLLTIEALREIIREHRDRGIDSISFDDPYAED